MYFTTVHTSALNHLGLVAVGLGFLGGIYEVVSASVAGDVFAVRCRVGAASGVLRGLRRSGGRFILGKAN